MRGQTLLRVFGVQPSLAQFISTCGLGWPTSLQQTEIAAGSITQQSTPIGAANANLQEQQGNLRPQQTQQQVDSVSDPLPPRYASLLSQTMLDISQLGVQGAPAPSSQAATQEATEWLLRRELEPDEHTRWLDHQRAKLEQPIEQLPVVHHPLYSAPQLAPGHRFPMQVFGRIHERLLKRGMASTEQVYSPVSLPSPEQLLSVHSHEYLGALLTGALDDARMRRIGFGEVARMPLLLERTLAEAAGTLLTARLALRCGLAVNTAGGTHHAHPSFGSGFCLVNDLAMTAKVLLREGAVSKVLIVDLDVHQGDGTAVCLADEPCAFTFSMHCESNFPARKATSDLDIRLPDGCDDAKYLSTLADTLNSLLESVRPDLVLYDAGVDIHEADKLGRLCISDAGLARRDACVLDACLAHGIPVAGYVGGGYAEDLDVLADRHLLLHAAALQMWEHRNL